MGFNTTSPRAAGRHAGLCLLAALLAGAAAAVAQEKAKGTGGDETVKDQSISLLIGGCGGVYFLPPLGELTVELVKQDRRSERPIAVRAILFGPDRTVLVDQWLPADAAGVGSPPRSSLRLSTVVEHLGVYGLMISATDDRYGTEMTWGFRTNCPRYLIETSRGHRDAAHQEPIVLAGTAAGEVCFRPRRGAFSLDLSGLLPGAGEVTCTDAEGTLLATLTPTADGQAAHTFAAADAPRSAVPWRLRLPRAKGVVQIDGVTRWNASDDYPNLSLWTPVASSWFAFHEVRWLLTPYSQTVYGKANSEQTMEFRVHNNALAERTVALSLEFPEGGVWPVTLPAANLRLGPRQGETLRVRCRLPEQGANWTCRLRATCGEVTTYASIIARVGEAPAAKPIPMPLALQPFQHENEQFGYRPDYPLDNQVYFALDNRPLVAGESTIRGLRDGKWSAASLRGPAGATVRLRSSKVAFGEANAVYALGTAGGAPVLLHSADGGETFSAAPLPGVRSHFDIEQFSGHNRPAGPPPFVRITQTAKDPKLMWRSVNDLHLFVPERRDGALLIGEPILLSANSLGISDHSGIPSSVVSRGTKIHVTWGEATDPQQTVPGVPTYVVTYDRDTKTLGQPVLVGYGPPANDVHNTPCITMDSKGFIHVLVGTHGRAFRYASSLQPNASAGGFTAAEEVGAGLGQTYVGLVCAPDDTLHLVFRLWQDHAERFPAGSYACLAQMSKRPGEPWSAPRPLIVAPFTDYSVYYHRLTIDRRGWLYLSYDYWSTYWFYRTDHPGNRRALLASADSGKTWKLAEAADFAP
jgi:hypothetical protein